MTTPWSLMRTVLLASDVPLMSGWLSSVTAPGSRSPVMLPWSSYTLSMVAPAVGVRAGETLPAGSMITAFDGCPASAKETLPAAMSAPFST
ncbi:hypothetical protein D9M72_403960 [compost metagenome]